MNTIIVNKHTEKTDSEHNNYVFIQLLLRALYIQACSNALFKTITFIADRILLLIELYYAFYTT